jgi:ATP phosphoribosyltransferase regulatory subunit
MNYDILNADERVMVALREMYRSYGYMPYKVSRFEEYDLYVQNRSALKSEQVLTFTDTNGKLMALKPDITLSIIKNTPCGGEPSRVYYTENVYRAPRGAYGFQEIMQTGLECIGAVDDYAMCEVAALAVKSLRAVSPDCVLNVSDLRVICALLADAEAAGQAEILTLCGEKNLGGLDEACRKWGVADKTRALLGRILQLAGPIEQALPKLLALDLPESCGDALATLRAIPAALGPEAKNVNLDFSVVNDTDYYSGLVFKGFVSGIPAAVLSGGRYDGLMARMGKRGGAIGFAVYLDQLERFYGASPEYDVDVLILYDETTDRAKLGKLAAALRAGGKTVRAQTGRGTLRCRELRDLTREGRA